MNVKNETTGEKKTIEDRRNSSSDKTNECCDTLRTRCAVTGKLYAARSNSLIFLTMIYPSDRFEN